MGNQIDPKVAAQAAEWAAPTLNAWAEAQAQRRQLAEEALEQLADRVKREEEVAAKIAQEQTAKDAAEAKAIAVVAAKEAGMAASGAGDTPSYLTKALAAATTADAPQYLMAAQRVAEKSQVVAAEKPEAVKEDVAVTGAVKLLKRCAQCDKEESIGGVPLVRCTACYKEGVYVTYCNAQCQVQPEFVA